MVQPRLTRTLKEVLDLRTMRTITADDLLNAGHDSYNHIRREATRSHRFGDDRYVCVRCGHGVYAPLLGRHPYWKHFAGAADTCPWYTGRSASVQKVSARQFEGRQESPLHHRLKHLIADLLRADPQAGEVVVDEYLMGADGRRRPDVRAQYGDLRLAFEIQLATTQIPIIIDREHFYENEGMGLLWLTWQFEAQPFERVPQSFKDIYYSHSKNLFSLDPETVSLSEKRRTLVIRVHAHGRGGWTTAFVTLGDLKWPGSGLPYALSVAQTWSDDFKERWLALPDSGVALWDARRQLLQEAIETIGLSVSPSNLEADAVPDLLNCLLSFQTGFPVGSDQSNLAELCNTFLAAKRRHRYAKIFEFAVRRTGNEELLKRSSIRKKLEEALDAEQVSKSLAPARIVRALFPEWAAPDQR